VCLKLIEKRGWFANGKLAALISENNELIAIFVASNKTASVHKPSSVRALNRKS
jgi:hypothetical protein